MDIKKNEDKDADNKNVDNNSPGARENKRKVIEKNVCVCPETGKIKGLADMWKSQVKCEMYACHKGGLITVLKCPRFLYDKDKPRPECKITPENPRGKKFPQCCEYIECSKQPEELRKGLAKLTYPLRS